MTPLRIVIVADVSPLVVEGGSERVVWEQAWRLAARGHRVCIVSRLPERGGPITATRQGVGFRHFTVARRPAWDFIRASILGARRVVAEEVRAHGADVLHFHQPLSAFGALTSSALRRLPSLYTFHSPASLEYRGRRGTTDLHRRGIAGGAGAALLRALERWSLARVTRIHVLSDYSAGLLGTLYGIGGDRVVKIEGGVDTRRFRPPDGPRDAVRAALGWSARRPILFTLRNLQPRMGLDELIRAVDHVRREVPDVLLLIGGDGALRAELEAFVARLGLAEHVRFLGFVEEGQLASCYQAADVFVLPTQALEGFGLVTVEALACGTPVLGTPVGATPEILAPLAKSLVFTGTTAAAMAEDLRRFLAARALDPSGAEALRHACRIYAETHYAWDGVVDRLEETLASLAGSRAPDDRCRVCGGALRVDLVFRDRTYQRCADCTTGMIDVLPDAARVRYLYDVEYPTAFGHARIARTRFRLFGSIVASLARRHPPGRLLDVGCSGGHLLAEATRLGWRGVGSDLSREACAVTRAGTGCPAVQSDGTALPVRDGAVDAVALLGIVDLTTDPSVTVSEAHRVLTPGGLLVIRVTNAAFHRPVARLLTAVGWLRRLAPLHPVLHVFAFTPRGLRTLVERAGFEVVEIRNSPLAAERGEASGGERRRAALLRGLLAAGAVAVTRLSGGRVLVAPSIELYARKRGGAEERPA